MSFDLWELAIEVLEVQITTYSDKPELRGLLKELAAWPEGAGERVLDAGCQPLFLLQRT